MGTLFDFVATILVHQSLQLFLVFLIAFIGTSLLRKQSAHLRYLLWLLVIAKCLTPAILSVPVAVLPPKTSTVAQPTRISGHSRISEHSSRHSNTLSPTAQHAATVKGARLHPQVHSSQPEPRSENESASTIVSQSAGFTQSIGETTTLGSWLVLGWIVVCTAFLTVLFWKMLETQSHLRRLRVPVDEKLQARFDSIAQSLSLGHTPRLYVVESTTQPFVFGWLCGSIYLPAHFVECESAEQQNAVLTHELAHVVRWDPGVNLLQMIVQAIFFFHPVVWWANRKIREEREKCCDEFVLSDTRTSAKEYCEAIVQMLDHKTGETRLQSTLAVGGSLKNIEQRMMAMLGSKRQFRRRPTLATMVALTLVALVTLPSAIVVTQAMQPPPAVESDPHEEPVLDDATEPSANVDSDSREKNESPTAAIDWQKNQKMEFRVINAETKQPLRNVDLELQYEGEGIDFSDVKVQTTDTDGKSIITLPNQPVKSVRVYPSKPGFVPLRVYWENEPTPVLPKTVTIPLQPGSTIGGQVIDIQGNAVAGVRVSVHYWGKSKGRGHGDSPDVRVNICDSNYNCKGFTTSDENGRWKLDVLPQTIDREEFYLYFQHKDYIGDPAFSYFVSTPVYETPASESLFDLTAVTKMRRGKKLQGVVTEKDAGAIAKANVFGFHQGLRTEHPVAVSDANGEFQITQQITKDAEKLARRGRPDEASQFVIEAKGYAPELIEVGSDDKRLAIQLKPGKTLRGRVVDQQGNPVEKAWVGAQSWRGHRRAVGSKSANTDNDGRFLFEDMPADEIIFDISKRGMMSTENFPMIAGAKTYTIKMMPPFVVKATVTDMETGEPIESCRVIRGIDYDDGRAPFWQLYNTQKVRGGNCELLFRQVGFQHRIRVEADGYTPQISPIIKIEKDSTKRELTIEFKMKRGEPIIGTTIDTNGNPLAGAKVILARTRININDQHRGIYDGENPVTTSDDQGKFQFPPETQPYCMVVIHPEGVGMVTEKEVELDRPIQIKPWNEENRQMQIIRLPTDGQSVDFPKRK